MRVDANKLIPLSALAAGPSGPEGRWQTGVADMDMAIGGGFAHGRVHELFAASSDDAAASAGFALTLAIGAMAMDGTTGTKPVIWLRSDRAARAGGVVHGAGWAELGGAPDACLFVLAEDAKSLLRAAVDALRCGGLGAVVVEGWGRMPELDLTASRRLSLAAKQSGVPLLLLRVDAETRWQVAAAPSHALAANAPGAPCFDVELLRCRSRPAGKSWRLEWDRDRKIFREAAVSGAVVPVPLRRPTAETGTGPLSRYAA
jgi:protein ImuA